MISLKNATKIYNGKEYSQKALNNVNIEIKEGEMIAITGASGSGKTTLLNILGGMDRLTEGEYYFEDNKVHEFTQKNMNVFRKNNISFVFQQYALMDEYTVYENVELPLLAKNISKKERKKIVLESLKKVGIEELEKKYPGNISGGQRQRAAIARAIASGNKLILADEPTGALDKENGDKIYELLEKLNKEGKTIVIVTHNDEIANKCPRQIIIKDGVVEE